MVAIFNWLKKKEEVDYESVLSDLSDKLHNTKLDLSNLVQRERSFMFSLIIYSISAYVLVVTVCIFWPDRHSTWQLSLLTTAPIVLGPVLIFLLRNLSLKLFERSRQNLIAKMQELTLLQQSKLEELKRKTDYYITKGLIERYDTPVKNSVTQKPKQPLPPNELNGPSLLPNTPLVARGAGVSHAKTNDQTPQTLQREAVPKNPFEPPAAPREPVHVGPKSFTDRLLDAVIGEPDPSHHKYALICENCFTHNGLVLPHEYANAKFKCKSCQTLNDRKDVHSHSFAVRTPRSSTLSKASSGENRRASMTDGKASEEVTTDAEQASGEDVPNLFLADLNPKEGEVEVPPQQGDVPTEEKSLDTKNASN